MRDGEKGITVGSQFDSAIDEKIENVTLYQPAYIKKGLKRLAGICPENAEVICNYITAEQNEINIKESTKEGKIKCLIWLSTGLDHKSYHIMKKEDILNYLGSLRQPESSDPKHRWIGTYNGRHRFEISFFGGMNQKFTPKFCIPLPKLNSLFTRYYKFCKWLFE